MHNLTLAATWTESHLAPPYPVHVLSGKVTTKKELLNDAWTKELNL